MMMKKTICIISTAVLLSLYFFNSCNMESSFAFNALAVDTTILVRGKNSFIANCASCHNFNQDGIGPQLAGITTERSVPWIKNFIKNPQKMIESGDTSAKKLFEKYKALMPSFGHLPEEEIDAIIAFIQTQKKQVRKLEKEDPNDLKNPIPDTIKTSDLLVGLEMVTQIPPSSDKLPLTRIIKLDYQPNNGAIFILDLRGKLYKLQNGQPKVYMDMATLKPKFIDKPGLATGFGSFAFHPGFSKNGILYTTHSEASGSAKADFDYADSIPVALQWVLTEWKTSPSGFPFSGKGREVFRVNMPTNIHGLQEIAFNRFAKPGDKDYGLLYIGIGDGGSAEKGYPLVSESPKKIWGSIIRIDPSGNNSGNGQYGIPTTNPYSKHDNLKFAPEVFAFGFRNPHRISWTKSGKLLAINIGEHNIEALNLINPGRFYGWPIREGTFQERFFNGSGKVYPLPANDSIYHVTYPLAQFDHDEGTAISGGFEYQGSLIPNLRRKYLFGDMGTGRLFFVNIIDLKLGEQAIIKKWNISMNGIPTTLAKLSENKRVDLRFGMDSEGEIYLLSKTYGKVYKLVNASRKPLTVYKQGSVIHK